MKVNVCFQFPFRNIVSVLYIEHIFLCSAKVDSFLFKLELKYNIKVAKNLYLNKNYKDSIYKYIREADQRERPGYKYSDLGYYIFKEAIEKEYKKPLNKLADEEFYRSLGANRTTYLPLQKFSKKGGGIL